MNRSEPILSQRERVLENARKRNRQFRLNRIFISVAVVLGISGVSAFSYWFTFGTEETISCTVTDKDRTRNSDGGSDMRIYTEECDVLKVADSAARLIFDSSSTYSKIKVGQTYEFDVYGIRIPFASQFQTIIAVR